MKKKNSHFVKLKFIWTPFMTEKRVDFDIMAANLLPLNKGGF